jgi:hypothetical protein
MFKTNLKKDKTMVEEMVEDSPPKPKSITPINIGSFEKVGNTSKYDELGVMDENIKLRQQLTRVIFAKGEEVTNDPEMLDMALKMMAANDKAVIAQARLKVDEESNAVQQDLVYALVSEAMSRNEEQRKEIKDIIPNSVETMVERVIDLPPASREITNSELVRGTVILTEKEVLGKLNTLPEGDNDSMGE